MKNQLSFLFIVAALVALVLGCGGGGGGGPIDPGNEFRSIKIVGVLGGKYIDPQNLKPGQNVQLQLIGIRENNSVSVLSAGNWTTDAPASVATVSGSGSVSAISATTGSYFVRTTYRGDNYTAPFGVKNNIGTVTGFVRNSSNEPIGYGVVEFYDASGDRVGQTRVNTDGTFVAQVPATAVSFLHNPTDLTGYYQQFLYNGGEYTMGVNDCRATLPTVTVGGTVSLASDIVVRVNNPNSPPPPPPGCFND